MTHGWLGYPREVRATHLVTALLVLSACSVETHGLGDPSPTRDGSPVVAPDAGPSDAASTDAPRDDGSMHDASLPDAGPYEVIDRECEAGSRFGGMVVVPDPGAYGGSAVVAPSGTPYWTDVASGTMPPSRVELPMTLRGGDYDVWVHLYATDAAHDALYAGFAPTDLRRFFHRRWGAWEWVRGNDDMPRALFFPSVSPGAHTLAIGVGEPDVRCDRVIVTNDPTFVPPPPP